MPKVHVVSPICLHWVTLRRIAFQRPIDRSGISSSRCTLMLDQSMYGQQPESDRREAEPWRPR